MQVNRLAGRLADWQTDRRTERQNSSLKGKYESKHKVTKSDRK